MCRPGSGAPLIPAQRKTQLTASSSADSTLPDPSYTFQIMGSGTLELTSLIILSRLKTESSPFDMLLFKSNTKKGIEIQIFHFLKAPAGSQ